MARIQWKWPRSLWIMGEQSYKDERNEIYMSGRPQSTTENNHTVYTLFSSVIVFLFQSSGQNI